MSVSVTLSFTEAVARTQILCPLSFTCGFHLPSTLLTGQWHYTYTSPYISAAWNIAGCDWSDNEGLCSASITAQLQVLNPPSSQPLKWDATTKRNTNRGRRRREKHTEDCGWHNVIRIWQEWLILWIKIVNLIAGCLCTWVGEMIIPVLPLPLPGHETTYCENTAISAKIERMTLFVESYLWRFYQRPYF